MEPYPGAQFGFIDYPDRQFGNGSVWIWTRTQSDGPEPLLTLTLSGGLEIELSDFEAVDATLKGDYLWQVLEIVIGGVPTVLEVRFMCLFMSLG